MTKKNSKNIIGLTLVEILIGIVITTIMMAAMYTSYNVVNQSYSKVTEKAKISRSSRDLVSMLMRDIRMSGFKYYAGQQQISDFLEATNTGECAAQGGVILPKLSYLYFENGFDDSKNSHNPVVIRKNTLGRDATTSLQSDICCDQIQIVYEDFNQNDVLQPFKRYRITYYAKTNNSGSFAVWKRIESYIKERTGCDFGITFDGEISEEDRLVALRGKWEDTPRVTADDRRVCEGCTPGVLVRDHIEDMEFIPFDENGRVIKNSSGQFPAPELSDIRDRLYDIRGVDVRLTLRSKELFFKKELSRIISGLSNTDATNQDKYLRDSVIVSVNTRNLGGQSF